MPCSLLVSKKTKNCIFWVQKSTKWKIVLTFGYKNDQIKNCTYIWVQKPTKLKIVLTFGFQTEQIKNCTSNKVGTSTNLRNCTNIVVTIPCKTKIVLTFELGLNQSNYIVLPLQVEYQLTQKLHCHWSCTKIHIEHFWLKYIVQTSDNVNKQKEVWTV